MNWIKLLYIPGAIGMVAAGYTAASLVPTLTGKAILLGALLGLFVYGYRRWEESPKEMEVSHGS